MAFQILEYIGKDISPIKKEKSPFLESEDPPIKLGVHNIKNYKGLRVSFHERIYRRAGWRKGDMITFRFDPKAMIGYFYQVNEGYTLSSKSHHRIDYITAKLPFKIGSQFPYVDTTIDILDDDVRVQNDEIWVDFADYQGLHLA